MREENAPSLRAVRERLAVLLTPEVAELLRVLFPDSLPATLQDPRDIATKIGEQRVIRAVEQIARQGERSANVLTSRPLLGGNRR